MPPRVKALLAIGTLLAIGLFLFWNPGYGELSPKGYQLAMALYSACNRKDATQLEKVAKLLDQSNAQGDLPAADAKWLTKVLELGRAQDWDSANQMIRRIMMDQAKES